MPRFPSEFHRSFWVRRFAAAIRTRNSAADLNGRLLCASCEMPDVLVNLRATFFLTAPRSSHMLGVSAYQSWEQEAKLSAISSLSIRKVIDFGLFFLLLVIPGFSQEFRATASGHVLDSTGKSIPNAQ